MAPAIPPAKATVKCKFPIRYGQELRGPGAIPFRNTKGVLMGLKKLRIRLGPRYHSL